MHLHGYLSAVPRIRRTNEHTAPCFDPRRAHGASQFVQSDTYLDQKAVAVPRVDLLAAEQLSHAGGGGLWWLPPALRIISS